MGQMVEIEARIAGYAAHLHAPEDIGLGDVDIIQAYNAWIASVGEQSTEEMYQAFQRGWFDAIDPV